ncbi:MAG: alpha/beta fold hydrolase [Myxococcales bacterium]|nr:alpha/beta fold hydrolase [Myxococcales bacterium]
MAVAPNDFLDRLTRFVAHHLLDGDGSELSPDTPLLEWGVLDSMSMLELLAFIQEDLGVAVPDEQVRPEHFQSLRRLDALLRSLSVVEPQRHQSRTITPASVVSRVANAGQGVATIDVRSATGQTHRVAHAPGGRPGWLLIPGPLNPSVSWGAVLRTQVGRTATWAPSLVGLGPDDDGTTVVPMSAQVQMLLDVQAALGDEPLVLVGNGLGGAIAARIARSRPERVAALVVVGFGVLADPWAWWQRMVATADDPTAYLAEAFYQMPSVSPALFRRVEGLLASPAYRGFLDEAEAVSLGTVFDGLTVPTLFVGAVDDRIVPRQAVEAAAERVPDSRIEWLARCGHLAHMERSQELLSVIRSFVEHTVLAPA